VALNALDRHVALVGFMGAGKTTLVGPVAERLGRAGYDLDEGATEFIAQHGMEAFRMQELQKTLFSLEGSTPSVFALGGGAVSAD
jgi:shikimate kinase